MRCSEHSLPILCFHLHVCTIFSSRRRASHLPSPPPTLGRARTTHDTATVAALQQHGPTERLVPRPSLSADPPPPPPPSLPEVRLAPAAAALLERRSRESVTRQDGCAADLLYFMHAEVYAAQQQRLQQRHQMGRVTQTVLGGASAAAAAKRTSSEEMLPETSNVLSEASLEARERQLADFMVGRSASAQNDGRMQTSSGASSGRAFDEGQHARPTALLFSQQQKLFALRRRLAYMLADTESVSGDGSKCWRRDEGGDGEGLLLSSVGRRAALALSLAQDVLDTSVSNGRNEVAEGVEGEEGGNGNRPELARGSGHFQRVSWSENSLRGGDGVPTSLAPYAAANSHESFSSAARCAFVYRSLAQPVELTRGEVEALLQWCADEVVAYAGGVAAAIQKRRPVNSSIIGAAMKDAGQCKIIGELHTDPDTEDRKGESDGGEGWGDAFKNENGGRGSVEGGEDVLQTSRPALRTNAVVPPPTLQRMTAQAFSRVSTTNTTAESTRMKSTAENRSVASCDLPDLTFSPEVVESTVAAVTALLELAAAFAQMSAQVVFANSTSIAETGQRSSFHGGSFDVDGRGEGCACETLRCGQVVRSVIDAVCDTLQLLMRSGVLEGYVRHLKHLQRDISSLTSSSQSADTRTPNASASRAHPASGPGQATLERHAEGVFQRLAFADAMMVNVLSCARESWPQAWQLARQMHGWNVQLQATLTESVRLHSSDAALGPDGDDGGDGSKSESSPFAAPSSNAAEVDVFLHAMPAEPLRMLLYILAQHGRLLEVADLCQRCSHTSATHTPAFPEPHPRFEVDGDRRDMPEAAVPPALRRLLVHLAAANAEPATAAHLLSSSSSVTAATASTGMDSASCCTQVDCVEAVVRAGEMPQRALSVTEYAMLLRRMLGERLPPSQPQRRSLQQQQQQHHQQGQQREEGRCSDSSSSCTGHNAKVKEKKSSSCSVGWWLSPSQVWRFSAGYSHHVRTILCLMGFQASAHRGLAATLSMEDLYVVLSVSRQLVARQRRETAELRGALKQARQSTGATMAGTGRQTLAAAQRQWREERWARWGVEERVPSLQDALQLQPHPPPKQRSLNTSTSARLPLLARRAMAPYSGHYMTSLCAAFAAAQQGTLSLAPSYCNPTAKATGTAGSAVLLSFVSREMLRLLQAVHYTQHIGGYWEAALRAVAAALQTGNNTASSSSSNSGLYSMWGTTGAGPLSSALPAREVDAAAALERHAAECVVEDVAYALAQAAEVSVTEQPTGATNGSSTQRLIAPLPTLAPYLSAYTVGALVQRPFRRALTWEQCLSLLPYTPLGSRSQLWLLRRVAQDGEGRRRVFATPAGTTHAVPRRRAENGTSARAGKVPGIPPITPLVSPALSFSQTAAQTAERLFEVQHSARRLHSRVQRHEMMMAGTRNNAGAPTSTAAPSSTGSTSAADRPVDANCDADAALLALLLEGHWSRALRAFEHALPRVQAGGAAHVVRLLIHADVWRDMGDAQRRPLVRLAVQSSAHASHGGAAALIEEVLQTSLEQGLWHTGLYFHQCVTAEQPEVVRQCRRAQVYAAQLCRGLLERTTMTRTVAQLTKAARQSQWAAAAACFLRYATRSEDGGMGDAASSATRAAEPAAAATSRPTAAEGTLQSTETAGQVDTSLHRHSASATAIPPTSSEELSRLVALMRVVDNSAAETTATRTDGHVSPFPSSAQTASRAFFFFAEGGRAVPAELAHVAQTVRYAMLHTPQLWQHALRWLPLSTLPLPYSHEVAVRALCAGDPAKLHALLPLQTAAALTAGAVDSAAVVRSDSATTAAATATALSIVAAARRHHRPRHPNEAVKEKQVAVAEALRVLQRAGAWADAILLYETAVAANCMPYGATTAVLETAAQGGAPWQVTLYYFFHMAQRLRPTVAATAVALQACAEGGQWALAFRVLQQTVLTQSAPVPRLVELAVSTALHCGVWARALAAAQQYRRTRDPRLAHTVLLTFVRTQHWDAAVEFFDECIRRGLRPLDASLELAIIASEAASAEYRRTALMVGTIASALEDLYKLSGAVLEHILFVQRHVRSASSSSSGRTAKVARVKTAVTDTVHHQTVGDDNGDGKTDAFGEDEHLVFNHHTTSAQPMTVMFAESHPFSFKDHRSGSRARR